MVLFPTEGEKSAGLPVYAVGLGQYYIVYIVYSPIYRKASQFCTIRYAEVI